MIFYYIKASNFVEIINKGGYYKTMQLIKCNLQMSLKNGYLDCEHQKEPSKWN